MQIFLLVARYKATKVAIHTALNGDGWVILDRSYYGDICFANVQKDLGYFDEDDYNTYMDLHRSMWANIHYPTAAIFLDASPRTCKNRINERLSKLTGRQCEAGIEQDYLFRLQQEINHLHNFIEGRCATVRYGYELTKTEDEIFELACKTADRLITPEKDRLSVYCPWGNTKDLFYRKGE